MTATASGKSPGWWSAIAPGVLIAATGVGAGDLVTAGLVGADLGVGICWAVLVGAAMKWLVNEALARYQLATGRSVLDGWGDLGLQWIFMLYLFVWSFAVAGALLNACGAAATALLPLADDPVYSKRIWGVGHGLAGVLLVLLGGFRLFERVMGVMIALMFLTVTCCALALAGDLDWAAVRFVDPLALDAEQRRGVFGLIGGVGGTVTLLSYGYWIREEGRSGSAGLRLCRIDLAVGYAMTALFGLAMIVIAAATPEIDGRGVQLLALLAERLGARLGPAAAWVFLIGAWGAIFSSLLGVWQGIPYLFADLVRVLGRRRTSPAQESPAAPLTATPAYRAFLLFLALPPMTLLWLRLEQVQLAYALLGAAFVPLLAGTLLIMTRAQQIPARMRGSLAANLALVATLVFFLWYGGLSAVDAVRRFTTG